MTVDPRRAVEILRKTVANDAVGLKGTVAQEWRDSMTLGALALEWCMAKEVLEETVAGPNAAHANAYIVFMDKWRAYLAAAHPEGKHGP